MSEQSVENKLESLVSEALSLRFEGVGLPPVSAAPQEILESLLGVRKRMDRVEEILSTVIRVRSSVHRKAKALSNQAQDAWDQKVVALSRTSGRSLDGSFEGPRERYATAGQATLEQQMDAREAERLGSVVDEAHAVVNQSRWGLDSLRQDHLAMLRVSSLEMSVDR